MNPSFLKSLRVPPASAYRHATVVVPSDTVDLPFATRAIRVNGFGHLRLMLVGDPLLQTTDPSAWGGEIVTFNFLKPGDEIAVSARRVMLTGTTMLSAGADVPPSIVALW